MSPIPHRVHTVGKRKIRRPLEVPFIAASFAPVYAADMDPDDSAATLA